MSPLGFDSGLVRFDSKRGSRQTDFRFQNSESDATLSLESLGSGGTCPGPAHGAVQSLLVVNVFVKVPGEG